MRRISGLMGMALALTVGAAGVAAAQQGTQDGGRQRGGVEQAGGQRRGPGRGMQEALFKGINLSAQQKSQLEELRKNDRGAKGEHKRGDKDKDGDHDRGANGANGARQRGDTTGFGARRAEMEQRREQRFAQIRNILTADQRAQFDRNVAEMKAQWSQRGGKR